MKTLHLLRHAKSSWEGRGVADHDRDLNDRGRRDAPRMGRALSEVCSAQLVHCSTATRARKTLEGLCEGWPAMRAIPHVFDDRLYTFDERELMAWLQDHDAPNDECFLIGHNPALTDLCNELVGRAALDNLPTAGYLRLGLPVDAWSDVDSGLGVLEAYQFPRDLARDT